MAMTEFARKFDRMETSAEVAQLVEQWSEEPPLREVRRLLDNSRLIPILAVKEQWFTWAIVLECGGQVALDEPFYFETEFDTSQRASAIVLARGPALKAAA